MPFTYICDSQKNLGAKKYTKFLLGCVLTQGGGGGHPPLDPTSHNFGAKSYAPICVPEKNKITENV